MTNKYIGQALSKSTERNIDFALMHMYCLIPIHFWIIISRYDMQHLRLCKYSKNVVTTLTSGKGWFD